MNLSHQAVNQLYEDRVKILRKQYKPRKRHSSQK